MTSNNKLYQTGTTATYKIAEQILPSQELLLCCWVTGMKTSMLLCTVYFMGILLCKRPVCEYFIH